MNEPIEGKRAIYVSISLICLIDVIFSPFEDEKK